MRKLSFAPAPAGANAALSFHRSCVVLELIVTSTLNGVLYGMLLFLMASGLTVIFSMLGVLNFAHTSFYMLGAFSDFRSAAGSAFGPGCWSRPC
jgi:branched-chain amino acid transport system permease protein